MKNQVVSLPQSRFKHGGDGKSPFKHDGTQSSDSVMPGNQRQDQIKKQPGPKTAQWSYVKGHPGLAF